MPCILYEIVFTFGVYLYHFVFNYVRRLEISLYQALLKNVVYYYNYYHNDTTNVAAAWVIFLLVS